MRGIRIISAMLLALTAISCSSLKSLEDYDPETYKKLDANGEVLGTVKVTRLGFTWEHYRPDDGRAQSLLNRLQKKALRKYGENIRLTDVEVGGMSVAPTLAMWGTGWAATLAIEIAAMTTDEGIVNESGERVFSDKTNTMMGLSLIPLLSFFLRSIDATAVVVRADSPMNNDMTLVTDDFIEQKRSYYLSNKSRIETKNTINELELSISDGKNKLYELRNQRDSMARDFISLIRTSGSPILITDADVIYPSEVYINYTNISGKLISETTFTLTPFNEAGKQSYSRTTGDSTKKIVSKIYVSPEERNIIVKPDVWDNPNIKYFEINSVEILFSDGSIFKTADIASLRFSEEQRQVLSDIDRMIALLIKSLAEKEELHRILNRK